jgi:hypothetical protein
LFLVTFLPARSAGKVFIMSADPSTSPNTTPTAEPRGLPPVHPPSARFLLELFLVPGLIVAVIVLVWLFVIWLTGGGSHTPEHFLQKLDDTNPEVRWRGAADLAQELPRNARLSNDADFALKLCERLQKALREDTEAEKRLRDKRSTLSKEDQAAERHKIDKEREYLVFLIGCLGRFTAPVGLPLLCQIAEQDTGLDPHPLALRRRQAVYALAQLGESQTRFDALTSVEKAVIINALSKGEEDPKRRDWAKVAESILLARAEGKSEAPGVDRTLAKCAVADDPVLREYAAFAANFWTGNDAQRKNIDAVLVKLTGDDGHGDALADPDPKGTSMVREAPGLFIRVNALLALCRRGSPLLDEDHLKQIKGALDEDRLRRDMQLVDADGKEGPNEAKVGFTLVQTLKAIGKLHQQGPDRDLKVLLPAIEMLTHHGNTEIQTAAKETLAELKSR